MRLALLNLKKGELLSVFHLHRNKDLEESMDRMRAEKAREQEDAQRNEAAQECFCSFCLHAEGAKKLLLEVWHLLGAYFFWK